MKKHLVFILHFMVSLVITILFITTFYEMEIANRIWKLIIILLWWFMTYLHLLNVIKEVIKDEQA